MRRPRQPRPVRTNYRKQWSDDELLAALRAWAEATTRCTSNVYDQDQQVNSELPALATICKRFGGWRHALERAGQQTESPPRPRPRYTQTQILAALRSWAADAQDLRSDSYDRVAATRGWPCRSTVILRFGSWRAALAAIDEQPVARRWTHDEVLVAVTQWVDHNRHDVTSVNYARAATRNLDLPCLQTVIAKLGVWSDVLELTWPRARQRSVGVGSG